MALFVKVRRGNSLELKIFESGIKLVGVLIGLRWRCHPVCFRAFLVICLISSLERIGREGSEKKEFNSHFLFRLICPAIVVLGFVMFYFERGFRLSTGGC